MSNRKQDTQLGRNAEIVALLSEHQRHLFSFVFTLVPNRADAEDIVHDTIVVVLQKFDQWDQESEFFPWARGIARNLARNFLRKKRASLKGSLDDEVFGNVVREWERIHSQQSARYEALMECFGELSASSRRLLMARYEIGGDVKAACEAAGISRQAAYKALSRSRRALLDCINRKLGSVSVGT